MPTYCNELVVGGQVKFSLKDDTVTDPSHIMAGYYGHLADGRRVLGTGQGGGPSVTAHSIEFEFSDGTSETITAYWNDTVFSDTLRTTKPTTYNGKTIDSASLDGTEWYNRFVFTTVYDGTPPLFTDAGNYLWIVELASVQIPAGSVWRVTINGTEYICTAQNSLAGVIIGNPKHVGGTDDGTDMPCAFYNYNSQGWSGDTITLTPGNYRVKIERQGA